ncbi:toll-like receptor 13 [Ahaetulla prasina]|uniref:toll-like receptor 13 n=1 Tax=Ahaetulla prasina TaxID=499056 RepID=UPI00264973EF|nr:toll-like receptor 13 [Ahaetulla prasina]XP_058052066.1 toll-like receptor 13 [Ahaetulla prasina]
MGTEKPRSAMGQMNFVYLFLAFVLFNPHGVTAYGFRNCIQAMKNPSYFKCMQRFLNNISSIVGDLPNNAEVVNASHNAIKVLPYGSFRHLPQLKVLQLSYNKMEKIEGGAFENLTALKKLNLSCNYLTNLSRGVFLGLGNLTLLLLHNNRLSVLHQEAFSPLRSLLDLQLQFNNLNSFDVVIQSVRKSNGLKYLNLCNNNLSFLQPGVGFPPSLYNLKLCNNSLRKMEGPGPRFLGNVTVLDLSYNKFSDASSFANFSLQRLQRLKLVGNNFDVLQLLDISNLKPRSLDYSGLHLNRASQLTKVCQHLGKSKRPFSLHLQSNNLKNMSDQALLACPPIQLLDLSRNRLRSVDCVRQMLNATAQSRLSKLWVEHNLLKHLRCCSNTAPFKELTAISFRFNRILSISSSAFHYAPNLTTLHLNINSIAFLHGKALKGLRQLRELRLDNNLLTDIYNNSFSDLSSLQTLNLRNNHVSVLFPGIFKSLGKLLILDLGGNNIHRLSNVSFEGLGNLSKLYLDNNNLQYISPSFFHPIERTLQVLDLMGNKIYFISKSQLKRPPFLNLRKVYDLKLQSQRPHGLKVIPSMFLKGLTSLRNLYLSENKILYIAPDVFDDLGQLEYLTLADISNGMGDFPPGIFKNLRNLTTLDLENAGFRTLTLEVFGNLSSLRYLLLGKNELQTFNSSVAKALPSLNYLDLRKCPLACTCTNVWFQNWLSNSLVQVVYLYNYSCNSGQQPSYVYSFDTHVCFQDIGLYLFSATFPVLVLWMLLPFLYHRSYWHIKYHIYILRAWVNDYWRRGKDEHYKFDAFVSYNSADESWVLEQLVPSLEKAGAPTFRLCLHHRDFQPGRYVIDNIVDSIHNSRHTICIISRRYLQSEWCSMEIQLASYRLFDELKDVLIPVILEAIPERELSVYHRMRKVMLKKTYIAWSPDPEAQRLFWAKLRTALKASNSEDKEEKMTDWFDHGDTSDMSLLQA